MREITFKALRADGKGWVEGQPVKDLHFEWSIFNPEEYQEYGIEIIPETLCQFTGLTDKNGAKIFEGDILNWYYPYSKDNELEKLTIQWGQVGWVLTGDIFKSDDCNEYNTYGYIKNCAVTGNIHDKT